MLQLHKDVYDAYVNAVSSTGGQTEKYCNDCGYKCIQFDGTIVEFDECASGRGRLVARWSVDLIGRVHVRLLDSSMKCGHSRS